MVNQAALQAAITNALRERAQIADAFLHEAFDLSGSGIFWPGNLQPSSSPGEYPVRQTGALLDSLDHRQIDPLTFAIGSFEDKDADGYAHAVDLETTPTSRGGRHFIEMALMDRELRTRLLEPTP